MPETAQFQQEREELKAVLGSGLLNRSPHLVQFLTYVCERYFEGRASQIKEYTIGVEAFGRSAGFDPKKDSIVRVEAHRLRKRLEEYYASGGAGHRIRIVIPSGQYIPQFVRYGSKLQTPSLSGLYRPFFKKRWLIAAPILLACVVAGFEHSPRPPDEVWSGPSNPVPAEFRMLAGYHGPPITDTQGHTWVADAYYTGGHSVRIPRVNAIQCVPDSHLLRTERSGRFSYAIPLDSGAYELHLYFAETEYGPGNPRGGGESSRVMQVSIDGVPAFPSLDALADAGAPNRLDERVLKDISPAADGKLHLAFESVTGPPAFLNAIEILPAAPGRIRPVRIVAQQHPVIDSEGRIWSADEFYLGGMQVFRRNTILDRDAESLYRGERYGDFSYRIPLAPGKYRLTLHFAETWFGSPESHEPALGSRVFNVFANGVALLENFDIAREAGPNRALTKVFENLEPSAQGVLSIHFVPVKNYAEVNAIEVIETQ
ncbi:MAG: malectin domain-containing carbohydrate-binding protein [Bryobacteraceae bacterium]